MIKIISWHLIGIIIFSSLLNEKVVSLSIYYTQINEIELDLECFNSNSSIVFQENFLYNCFFPDSFAPNETRKKWIYLPHVPNLESCNAQISYFDRSREVATGKFQIDGFKAAEMTSDWHKTYNWKLEELDIEVNVRKGCFEQALNAERFVLLFKYTFAQIPIIMSDSFWGRNNDIMVSNGPKVLFFNDHIRVALSQMVPPSINSHFPLIFADHPFAHFYASPPFDVAADSSHPIQMENEKIDLIEKL